MPLQQERGIGTLDTTLTTVLLTIAGDYTVRITGTFCNTGATDRLLTIEAAGIRLFQGDATNSPLRGGQTLTIDLTLKMLTGETITGGQSVGADVDYFLTCAVVPL